MPVAPFAAYSGRIASAATSVSFDVGGSWDSYALVIPAMTSGSAMGIRVSDKADGTYYPLYHAPTIASAPVAVSIASGITNCAVGLPNTLGQYFQVYLATATADTAYTFKVLCKGN
jgi:hypothetical protein